MVISSMTNLKMNIRNCIVAVLNLNLILPFFSLLPPLYYFTCWPYEWLKNNWWKFTETFWKIPSSRTNFGDPKYNRINSYHILNASINFVLRPERFNGSIIKYLTDLFLLLFPPVIILLWPCCFLKYTVSECNIYCWCFYLLFRNYYFYVVLSLWIAMNILIEKKY